MGSKEDRERLKEEYKDHYRAIRDARKRVAESEKMAKITSALENMNADKLMESFDHMMHKVREKIEIAEAKLDMAMDSRKEQRLDDAFDELERKRKTSEILHKMRSEMGLMQTEMDEQLKQMHDSEKTLGPVQNQHQTTSSNDSNVEKTLGLNNKKKSNH